MRKVATGLAAAALAMALGIAPILPGPVARAKGPCDGDNPNFDGMACSECMRVNGSATAPACFYPPYYGGPGGLNSQGPPADTAPVQTPPPPADTAPVQTPPPPADTAPVQTPEVVPPPPTPIPVVTPEINPPASGGPTIVLVVGPPRSVDATPDAIALAKGALLVRINPAAPPPPPTRMDFAQLVQRAVSARGSSVDVVHVDGQALVRPRHWGYVDYDIYDRPILFNPIGEALTFRFFYDGAFREVFLPAGGRVVLDVAVAGVFPFSAVGVSYVVSGSFIGGGWIPPDGWSGPPPPDYNPPASPVVYNDVSAFVPAADETVRIGEVVVVGHDDSQPAGSQDTFMLDDSTLAWGQINPPNSGAQINVTKTQSLPGVGPTENGGLLATLAAPPQPSHPWWPWAAGGAALVVAAGLAAWLVVRRKRSPGQTV